MNIRILPALAAMIAVCFAAPVLAQEDSDGPLPFDALPADAASPFGGMAISPTRVVLDAGGRGASVTLYNSGGAPVTYRIENTELALDEAGNYRSLEDGEDAPWAATPYLRYSPRQVTLQPGQRQSVKIVARAPRDLPPGEFRSHLSFSSIPLVQDAAEPDDSATDGEAGDTVSVSVGMDYRITIPVLLRVGQPEGGSAILSAVPAQGDARTLQVTIARTGQRGDYGVVRAFDRAGNQIGILRGIGILPPASTRIVNLPLQGDEAAVRVTYSQDDVGPDAGPLLTEYTLP